MTSLRVLDAMVSRPTSKIEKRIRSPISKDTANLIERVALWSKIAEIEGDVVCLREIVQQGCGDGSRLFHSSRFMMSSDSSSSPV